MWTKPMFYIGIGLLVLSVSTITLLVVCCNHRFEKDEEFLISEELKEQFEDNEMDDIKTKSNLKKQMDEEKELEKKKIKEKEKEELEKKKNQNINNIENKENEKENEIKKPEDEKKTEKIELSSSNVEKTKIENEPPKKLEDEKNKTINELLTNDEKKVIKSLRKNFQFKKISFFARQYYTKFQFGIIDMILTVFRVGNEQILKKCGSDAYYYLYFRFLKKLKKKKKIKKKKKLKKKKLKKKKKIKKKKN
jgi:hypothetical protein